MKKKILYIYGYGSNPDSTTKNNLQDLLGNEYEIISIEYSQENPEQAIKELDKFISKNNIDCVIGSSLGGFFTIYLKSDVKKIVINPCVFPSIQLPKLGCKQHVADKYNKIEYNTRDIKNVIGFFGDHDELFSYKRVFELYGKRAYSFSSGHRPSKDELSKIIPFVKSHL